MTAALRRIAQRAGVRPLYFYAVSLLCVAALAFAFWRDRQEMQIAGPQPAVGLYWIENVNPTTPPGVSAPLWQLLIRTDTPSMYYKSGAANTAWTLIGTGTSSGGTVTSIACGNGLSCSPSSPITTTGTISLSVPAANAVIRSTGTALGASSMTDDGTEVTATGAVRASSAITPTAFTGATVNNYNPTGLATAYIIEQAVNTGDTVINGLTAQPTGTIIIFRNLGPFNLNFTNHNAGSLAANQFDCPGGTTQGLEPNYSLILRYSASSQWEIVGWAINHLGSLTVSTVTNLGQLRYSVPQAYTTTGSANNVTLNSSTTVFQYTGTADATITGITGTSAGRVLFVVNDSGHNLTLPNQSGSSSSANTFSNIGAMDIVLTGTSSNAFYIWDGVGLRWQMISYASTTRRGTITLSGGTGTATVNSGTICVCTDTSVTPTAVGCAVSGTTLTAKGTSTDVISYLCF